MLGTDPFMQSRLSFLNSDNQFTAMKLREAICFLILCIFMSGCCIREKIDYSYKSIAIGTPYEVVVKKFPGELHKGRTAYLFEHDPESVRKRGEDFVARVLNEYYGYGIRYKKLLVILYFDSDKKFTKYKEYKQ